MRARNAAIGTTELQGDTTLRVIQGLSLSNASVGRNLNLTAGSRRRWVASLFVVTPASARVRWG